VKKKLGAELVTIPNDQILAIARSIDPKPTEAETLPAAAIAAQSISGCCQRSSSGRSSRGF
jgi:hypothetical protein